jgi:hypothetical protein
MPNNPTSSVPAAQKIEKLKLDITDDCGYNHIYKKINQIIDHLNADQPESRSTEDSSPKDDNSPEAYIKRQQEFDEALNKLRQSSPQQPAEPTQSAAGSEGSWEERFREGFTRTRDEWDITTPDDPMWTILSYCEDFIKQELARQREEIRQGLDKLMSEDFANKLAENIEIYCGRKECPICGADPVRQRKVILAHLDQKGK